ncbi:AMP-binding protein [Anabaena cylindrica FACHB-243]|uniref:O-succinylbenzoate--CoA ligase n=1 Tax=Anabaena cylindrica (strain ATCC 27899 / PCC 7122) TaxID=272123 RepID=K9ZRC3_ANACC|nr:MULTISPECIES: acyl--CoA ligase [Anabaena]AFZ60930.1 o-succinylbenzoate--CoA ligase [Anabaena cylindrica PCC 7122]MBD2420450.1 AMP-binding protein [Anabaena cylindrica FACHB-243]MBY5282378.1 AMP-binding protein [Anabaena sp. CCAP 1446/1C]MBY5306304.1 AMP-binding protein [Anabaena sp. CCAP 1446/1C]MCM2406924.1 acyl--CoA ligase [Anabaena sp. CCAP 1446/1C]
MNLFNLLTKENNHSALITPDGSIITYQQLRDNITELTSQLHSFGLKKGDRIAIAMTNGVPMAITFLASALCGTAAPLNPKYKQEEFAFYYEDTQAKALITLSETPEAAIAAVTSDMMLINAKINNNGTLNFELVKPTSTATINSEPPNADDIAMILHTSGTTSRPKRVPIRHRNLIASANNIISAYSLTSTDITLCLMPLFHIHGLIGCLLATLASGGTLICPHGFNALEFWKLVETYKPTWYSAAPTMHQTILARAIRNQEIVKRNPFRFIRSSSASLAPVIIEQMEKTLNSPVLESYSMTEAAHLMTTNPLPPKIRKPGTVGYGFNVDVRIMDDEGNLLNQGSLGEVVVKGANVIDGYENNPDANATAFVNGWFRTGDQGIIDADGYLRLTGRIKELINRGGEKISPLEVDNVLLRHPAVAEALAFAIPHNSLGEEIHAAVVLKLEVSEKELKQHCSNTLADFKVPKQIHILEALPRGATGKLQRLSMAKLLNIG